MAGRKGGGGIMFIDMEKADKLTHQEIDYRIDVMRTWNFDLQDKLGTVIIGLGLASEAGEVADVIKKHVEQGHELNHEKIKLELGDAFYYMTLIMIIEGITLADVIEANIEKRQQRYPDGFDVQRSINRE